MVEDRGMCDFTTTLKWIKLFEQLLTIHTYFNYVKLTNQLAVVYLI